MTKFTKLACLCIAYILLVILWGAFVRATGSGAGCGDHWPLCNGEVIPREPKIQTIIEFSHRVTSGLSLILILYMVRRAFITFPQGHRVRSMAVASMVFLIIEALIGAVLVIFGLVEFNASLSRAVSMVLHLVNTFILLSCLTLTAWWSSKDDGSVLSFRQFKVSTFLWFFLSMGMLVVGASGAISSLGNALFPPESLASGLLQRFEATAHFLIQLRVYHPLLAVGVSLMMVFFLAYHYFKSASQDNGKAINTAKTIIVLYFLITLQVAWGFMTLVMLAPVYMQLGHLLLADFIWIAWTIYGSLILSVSHSKELASS